MRLGITGANGFLGKHLLTACLSNEMHVDAFVRLNADLTGIEEHANLTVHKLDYNDLDTCLSKLEKKQGSFDFFIHNAAITVSLRREEYFAINSDLTTEVLDAIQSSQVLNRGKFVLISSYAANGPFGSIGPVSDYGRSKLEAEKKVEKSGLNNLIVRPTGIYGPGDSAFLPLFKLARKGVYPLSAPKSQKVTMIHGEDLASGIVSAMRSETGILHFYDGNIYDHIALRESLELVFNRKIRFIKFPAVVALVSLRLANIFDKILKKRPSLTAEKFEEISRDWNLIDDESLRHASIPSKFDLKSGFQNTYLDYKSKKLL